MSRMESTDFWIFGLRDGKCVASACKLAGQDGEKFNRQTVTKWAKQNYDIITLHKDDPTAKAYHDQMWKDANDRAAIYQKASDK